MGCIPAPTCKSALAEATRLWPNRSRASDGICGDARHQATKSDHNMGNAWDLTHDPANGCDAHALAEYIKARLDPRVKYIISNARIWNPSISPNWRHYSGSNPHVKHIHVSIKAEARNDTRPWFSLALKPSQTIAYKDQEDAVSAPAVALAGGQEHVFVRGTDKALWHGWKPIGTGSWSWEGLGGTLESGPSVTTEGSRITVAAKGTDGAAWLITWDGSKWTPWYTAGGQIA